MLIHASSFRAHEARVRRYGLALGLSLAGNVMLGFALAVIIAGKLL